MVSRSPGCDDRVWGIIRLIIFSMHNVKGFGFHARKTYRKDQLFFKSFTSVAVLGHLQESIFWIIMAGRSFSTKQTPITARFHRSKIKPFKNPRLQK
jgi:hypothetical protein